MQENSANSRTCLWITFTLRVAAKGSSPLALSRHGHVPGPAVNVNHNKGFPKASYQSALMLTCSSLRSRERTACVASEASRRASGEGLETNATG